MDAREELSARLRALRGGTNKDAKTAEGKLLSFMEDVLAYNEKVNLTAIKDRDEFIVKHLLDSLLCCDTEEFITAESVVDVGSGAGFPGIPLSVVYDEKSFVLADSLGKRVDFLKAEKQRLGLERLQAVQARAEELGRASEYRESFGLCVSRAVAALPVLLEYCLPLVSVGGSFIAYKGPNYEEELRVAERAARLLGGELKAAKEYELAGQRRSLLVFAKLRLTPAAYPRRAGLPQRRPL